MKKRKVLMIEDDLDDRYITEKYFTEQGFKVSLEFYEDSGDIITYLSGLDAARLPELIVFDPGKRGLGTLEQLKTHPQFKAIPIVVVSELTTTARVKQAYLLGANSFVEKPSTHALTAEKIGTFAKYWFDVVKL